MLRVLLALLVACAACEPGERRECNDSPLTMSSCVGPDGQPCEPVGTACDPLTWSCCAQQRCAWVADGGGSFACVEDLGALELVAPCEVSDAGIDPCGRGMRCFGATPETVWPSCASVSREFIDSNFDGLGDIAEHRYWGCAPIREDEGPTVRYARPPTLAIDPASAIRSL